MLLVPVTLGLAGFGVLAYWWAWRNRQFEDLDTAAARLLFEEENREGKDRHEG